MDVGIFVRVSVIDKKNKESPEIHEERGRRYAEAKGWNVVRVYMLPSISGKTTKNLIQTRQMLEDIRSGVIEGLIFSKLARLARNTEELLYYSKYFQKHNANLISLNESIDTSTSSGRLFYTMIAAMAQWERENNLERMMASLQTRRAMGKFTGGMASYGYKIEDSQIVIHEEEAPVRKLIYELFLEHKRRSTVARILNEKGYRTRKNKKWTDVTITRLLKNSDAKGVRKSNYRRVPTEDNPSHVKPKEEWIFTPCPPLIKEELWDACNAIIREQELNSKQTKPLNQRVHLFTGYLFCHNGHPMKMQTKTNKYSCPKCRVRIDKDDLEDIFKTRIEQFIISDEEISTYLSSSSQEERLKEDEIELTIKEIGKLDDKMDGLIQLNINGEIPTKGFKKHYEPLHEQKEQLEQNLLVLKEELEQMKITKNSLSVVLDKSKELYKNWKNLDRPEKRHIVQSVTNRITFDGRNINFSLKQIAPLSALEMGQNGQRQGTISLHGTKQQRSLKNMCTKGVK
jgi:site-specific DNA recombinase